MLKPNQLTIHTPHECRHAYRPLPDVASPDAVYASDIITRWITGGEVVQIFNTVAVYAHKGGITHLTRVSTMR